MLDFFCAPYRDHLRRYRFAIERNSYVGTLGIQTAFCCFFLFFFISFLASLSFDFTRYRHADKHSRVAFFFFERVSPFRSTFVKKDTHARVCPLISNIRNMEISLVCNKMPFIREFHAVTIDLLLARPSDLLRSFRRELRIFPLEFLIQCLVDRGISWIF